MPITKTGRFSMNPAYAEALDRASQNANDGDGPDGEQDDQQDAQQAAGNSNDKNAQKKAAVKRIEIEPAENGGFVSRTQREQNEDQGGANHDDWAPPYEEPELRAHPDGVNLLKFLGRELM